jgi:hypothetical protein
VAAAATLASAGTCAALYLAGASTDRLYYGTDARAQSLMVGALLAVVLAGRPGSVRSDRDSRALATAGIVGSAVLVIGLHAVQGNGPFLYEGGFLLVALATAAVVLLVTVQPRHPLSRALAWDPLRYIGRVSYGLYLYHWPVFLVLTQLRTGLRGPVLLATRFGATFLAAHLSFRLVENPIRTRSFAASRPRLPARFGTLATPAVLVAVLFAVTTSSGGAAGAATPAPGAGYVAPGGAAASHPEHVLLIGDSMALTLGAGLGPGAGAWGVSLDNQGVIGCDLDPGTTVNIEGSINRTAEGCPRWRTDWANLVARTNPDVVVVLLGRWECLNRVYGGGWTTIGRPAFDAHLQSELAEIIRIGSSRGAQVVFLTLPYIAETTVQPDGTPWAVNLPSRTDAYNRDVRAAAALYPGSAHVLDLNRLLDPGGRYVSKIDGIRVRSYDDEHISVAGGMWLRQFLLPGITLVGASHFQSRPTPP